MPPPSDSLLEFNLENVVLAEAVAPQPDEWIHLVFENDGTGRVVGRTTKGPLPPTTRPEDVPLTVTWADPPPPGSKI